MSSCLNIKLKSLRRLSLKVRCILHPVRCILHPGSVHFALKIYLVYTLEYLHSFFSKQLLFEVHYAILSISSKIFLLIKKTNEGKGMILMENDCIPVNRKILYNDSLNCKEKIALIILLDTEAGSISYDHLAKKWTLPNQLQLQQSKALKIRVF